MTTADSGGVAPSLTARQLVDAVPGLGETGIEIDVLTFRTKPGASLTIDDLTELTTSLGDYWEAGIVGAVVTQGTDTIEESAYTLDLLHHGPQPLVVTGAMRNPTLAGADGPASRQPAPTVRLYTATLGDDGAALGLLTGGADGLVVAGFGVGHVPEPWLATLTEVAGRIPVVLTSRTGSGPVLAQTYGFPDSERDLISRGLIPAGLLDPFKARILQHLALAAGADLNQVSAAFAATTGLGTRPEWPWTTEAAQPAHAMAGGA
ncbi:asparaginase [Actinoplanes sp. CA-030573]|uniref:asparaginase n=1 Tax=Actinoplanes sp. CA-030573 TaxID=3239898 RepID=UPI003D8F675F